tara:strand:- start:196 stop:348 length:153 start_codon:yes stop_codon:yes gene_type:complete
MSQHTALAFPRTFFLQMLQGNLLLVRVISIAKLNLHAEMKKKIKIENQID